MIELPAVALPLALLALFLGVGLFCYDRWGIRLGGVLVLPLLLAYVIVDPNALWVFAFASTVSFAGGHVAYERTFVYGRRLLYLFLLLGITATLVALLWIPLRGETAMMALLPGLFAYNLHREGRYSAGLAAFLLWFAILLSACAAGYWIIANVQGGAFSGGIPGLVETASAASVAAAGGTALHPGGGAE